MARGVARKATGGGGRLAGLGVINYVHLKNTCAETCMGVFNDDNILCVKHDG